MNDQLLEKAKTLLKDKRLLINGISQRAAELAHGGKALIPVNPEVDKDYLDIALREVIEGKLVIHARDEVPPTPVL